MKKLLLALLMFSGCTTLENIPAESLYYGLDFKKYSSEGFLITPEMYQGEYLTMGFVNYESYPGANYNYNRFPRWKIQEISTLSALDSIYIICINMGANALVNFRIESIEKDYSVISNPIKLTGIKISGYAIKR